MTNGFIVAEDLALKTHLAGITVNDEKVTNRPVQVWFGYPDVELRKQEFPFITIDLIDIVPANDRQTSGYLYDSDYRGTTAPTEGVFEYQIPVAYDLMYQVSSYSRHPRHDREIMHQLHGKFPSKFGYLRVPNELGTEFSARSMFLDGFIKRDSVESDSGNRRLLRSIFTVRVISEMTPLANRPSIPLVDEVNVNDTTTNIPSDYTPVQ